MKASPSLTSVKPGMAHFDDQAGQDSDLLLGEQLGVIVFGEEALDATIDPLAVGRRRSRNLNI